MTEREARQKASERARTKRAWRYVVWSPEDSDTPGQHYHVSTEFDLDAFYNGAEVVAAFGPDGMAQ